MSLEVETGWVPETCPFCFSLLIDGDRLRPLAPLCLCLTPAPTRLLLTCLDASPPSTPQKVCGWETVQRDWFPEQQSICFVKAVRKKRWEDSVCACVHTCMCVRVCVKINTHTSLHTPSHVLKGY